MFHPNETQMKNDLRDTLFQITRGKEKANNHGKNFITKLTNSRHWPIRINIGNKTSKFAPGPNYPPNGNQDHNSAMAPANTQKWDNYAVKLLSHILSAIIAEGERWRLYMCVRVCVRACVR